MGETVCRFGTFSCARIRLFLVVLFCTNGFYVQAQFETQNQTPHPAVVRIITRHGQVTSFGSGTLIAKKTNYGFVITNWHVIRDSNGYVTVRFPDKRDYEAAVVAVDDRWDLALLVIAEPQGVEPVVISPTIPKIGENYWVAGYRRDGIYRIQGGRCLAFQQPEPNNIEAELIEIAVPSEHGDSGGPVFNAKYELAGVLFGSDKIATMASHCGRVIKFLEQAASHVASLPAGPEAVIKAASLSQQSILQRGGLASNSFALRETNHSISPSHSVASSSSTFGGSGIRPRNNMQSSESQQLTRLQRHGFLNLQYDIAAANALLAAENRTEFISRSSVPTSGNSSPIGAAVPASPQSAGTAHPDAIAQSLSRTAIPGNNAASMATTDTTTRTTVNIPGSTQYSGSGTSSLSTNTDTTVARLGQTDQTQNRIDRSRTGYEGTAAVSPAEAI
ncbi:MAG: serine protease, partial [Planctomycetaceae bacterium]|nr:serine protease [Planctomycetaceae bacterium]